MRRARQRLRRPLREAGAAAARLQEAGLIEHTDSGPRGSKTYALTERGLGEVRRWLRETEPDRRTRNDAALRLFFLWLLEPDEARAQLERERDYWRGVLSELETIREQPPGTTRKEKVFRLALEGGIRTVEARVAWLESAFDEWRAGDSVE